MKDRLSTNEVERLNQLIADTDERYITSELHKLQTELDKLESAHRETKTRLPKKYKSKLWAIWLLQGASLSMFKWSILCIKSRTPIAYISMNLRLQFELTEQIKYFNDAKNNKDPRIQKWFNSINPLLNRNNGEKPEYTTFKLNGSNSNWTSETSAVNHYLSTYTHASYDLTNSLFQYDSKKQSIEYYSLVPPQGAQRLSISIAKIYLHFSQEAFKY